mgnify:CR=1 FL=1
MKITDVISRCFKRNKKPSVLKVLSVLLYYNNASFRGISKSISFLCKVSHEAVRQWWLSIKGLFAIEKKERRILAIDETKVKVNGIQCYVWAVIDVETKEILSTLVTFSRSHLDTMTIMKKALKFCTNKPLVLTDGGPWYPWAIKRLGCSWQHKTRGLRNHIERWFGRFKFKIKNFFKNFRGINIHSGIDNIQKFLNSFVDLYHVLIVANWR